MNDRNLKSPGIKRSLRVLLVVSLALNLLVVGAVLGIGVTHRGDDRPHSSRASHPGGLLTAALERQDRHAVGQELRNAMREERVARGDSGNDFSAVISALTATPYDPEVTREAVEMQMQQVTRRVDLGVDILLERFNAMNAADRAAYVERLQKVLEREPRGHSKGRRDRENDRSERHE